MALELSLFWKIVIVVLSSIPLYFALGIVGAKNAGFFKVVLVNFLVGIVASSISAYFGLFAGIISFIAMLFIYREMFGIGWLSAFLVWILQIIIIVVIVAFLALALIV